MTLAAQALFGAAFAWLAAGILYTDQVHKRIANERLLRLSALALSAYALLAAAAWAASRGGFGLSFPYPRAEFFAAAAGTALSGAAAGVLLWRLGAWPAGDAKLFAVLALLLPVADPGSPLLPWRLALVFLMNVFIPAALFVAAKTLWWVWHDKVRQPAGFWREMGLARMPAFLAKSQAEVLARLRAGLKDFSPRAAASAAADMAAMTVVGAAATSWLAPALGLRLPGPLLGMGACLAWDALRAPLGRLSWALCAGGLFWAASAAPPDVMEFFWRHWRQWAFFVSFMGLGMAAVRLFLGEDSRLVTLFWVGALFLGLVGPQWILGAWGLTGAAGLLRWAAWGALFGLVYVLVTSFLEEDIDRLPPERIHSRLVPAGATLALLRSEPELYEERFARVYPDGLTEEQAAALADLCRRRGVPDAAFRRTIPFAKWIFLGAVLTWALRRDVLTLLLGG